MKKWISLIFILSACASHEVTPTGLTLMSESEYEKIVDASSDKIENYKGLYNSLQASATLISSKVAMAQLDQSARLYQWDQSKFNTERLAVQEKLNQQTEIFLSFYTPEKKHDDLNKFNSVWKVFLDIGGQRYEGKVTKLKAQTIELQGLYSYHNRFSTPYSLVFPISVRKVESNIGKLTLTGPVDSAQLTFKSSN